MRLILALALLASVSAFADVEVRGAWLKPATHGLSGVISMDLVNISDKPYTLVGASVPVSRLTKIQRTEFGAFGRRVIHPVKGVDVPQSSFVSLNENGLHIMLQGVKDALIIGAEVPVTLEFKNAPEQTVRIPILGRAPDERDM